MESKRGQKIEAKERMEIERKSEGEREKYRRKLIENSCGIYGEDSGTEDRATVGRGGKEGKRAVLAYREKTRRVRKEKERWKGVAGKRGDTLISERIYKQPPRVPRIVRPSPTSYIYC